MPIGHFVGVNTRQEVGHFRNALLENLKQRGTSESVIEIERIMAELPELDWLKWHLIEAKKNARRHSWIPLTPEKLSGILAAKNMTVENAQLVNLMSAKFVTDEEIGNLAFNKRTVRDVVNLADFLKTYRDNPNNIVFFIGAGLSVPLFPSWSVALKKMIEERSLRRGIPERTAELEEMLGKNQFLEVADICARDLGENVYRAFIEKHFDKDFTVADIPKAYATLLDLNPQTILTTNYDRIPNVYSGGKYRFFTNQESDGTGFSNERKTDCFQTSRQRYSTEINCFYEFGVSKNIPRFII